MSLLEVTFSITVADEFRRNFKHNNTSIRLPQCLTRILFQHLLSTAENMFRKAINWRGDFKLLWSRISSVYNSQSLSKANCPREQLQLMATFLLTTSLVCNVTESLILHAKSYHCRFDVHSTDNQTRKRQFEIFVIVYYFKTIHENDVINIA